MLCLHNSLSHDRIERILSSCGVSTDILSLLESGTAIHQEVLEQLLSHNRNSYNTNKHKIISCKAGNLIARQMFPSMIDYKEFIHFLVGVMVDYRSVC